MTEMDQMMEHLLAEMKTYQERLEAKLDSHQKEMKVTRANQEKMKARMEAVLKTSQE
jgi:hypothetical protein